MKGKSALGRFNCNRVWDIRDSFVSRLRRKPLATTLTLTIHLLEHELHAQFARLRVSRASIHLYPLLVKGPTVPSASLRLNECTSLFLYVSHTYTVSYIAIHSSSRYLFLPSGITSVFMLPSRASYSPSAPFFRPSSWLVQLAGSTYV